MAKKKKKIVLTPEQRMEAKYNRAIRRMNGAEHMAQAEDRMKMNRQAMRMFRSLGEYKDSRAYFVKCKKRMPRLREEFRESVYLEGMALKRQAKKGADYTEAIAAFKRLKVPYKDADGQIKECEQLRKQAKKRERMRGRLINASLWALLAVAVCFVLYLRTPAAFYQEGRFMMKLQDYERAKNLFRKSEGYKDTEQLVLECYYGRAMQYEKAGEPEKAVRILQTRVGDYKDALEKKAQFEQEIFADARVGDTVVFWNAKWIVADSREDRLLLVMRTPQYFEVPFASGKSGFSWENSTLRDWLNTDFIDLSFSPAEKESLLSVKLKTEPNTADRVEKMESIDTEDAVFLLSEQEAGNYQTILTGEGNRHSWWLRTPGAREESAEYVTADGRIITYGNIMTSTDIAVRPAFWVRVD